MDHTIIPRHKNWERQKINRADLVMYEFIYFVGEGRHIHLTIK